MKIRFVNSLFTCLLFISCYHQINVLEEIRNDEGQLISKKIYDRNNDIIIYEEYIDEKLSLRKTMKEKEQWVKYEEYAEDGTIWMESVYANSIIVYKKIYDRNGFLHLEKKHFQNFNKGITIFYDSIGRTGFLRFGDNKESELKIIFDTLNNPIKVITNDSTIILRH